MPVGVAQRSRGAVRLSVRTRTNATVIDRLYQSGPLRARIVYPEAAAWTTCVLLNTAGGIAGGDDLSIEAKAGDGTALTLTTQGAERVYRARPEDAPARIATTLRLAAGARVEYLPQETILFDNSALDRQLRIDMAGDAHFLGIEALIFGRTAMGEAVRRARLADTILLRRDGRLVFRDALRLPETVAATMARRTIGGGAAAMATILLVTPDAALRLDAVREALGESDAGASAWNGLLLVRVLAQDGAALRAVTMRVLAVLRDRRKLPRNWDC